MPFVEKVKPWVEIVGVCAALLGIVFLVIQTIELRNQSRIVAATLDQTYRQDTFDKALGFDEFIIEHAYTYEMVTSVPGEPAYAELEETLKDPKKGAELNAIAVHVMDFYDYILLDYTPDTYPTLGVVDDEAMDSNKAEAEGFIAWSDSIRTAFRSGSHLCRMFQERQKSYGKSSFVDRISGAGYCG